MVAKRVGAAVFTAAAVVAVAACQPGPGPGMPNQTAPPPQVSRAPASPPARICGNTSFLAGPASPPAGAIVVPAGDNANVDFRRAGRTYWFAPGVHTLGSGEFNQIIPADNSTFIGGPGAILDGRDLNRYAFTQQARNVRIAYLTIRNFGRGPAANHQQGVVNHDAGDNWVIERNTVIANDGAGVFVGDGNVVRYNCLKDNGQYGFSAYEAGRRRQRHHRPQRGDGQQQGRLGVPHRRLRLQRWRQVLGDQRRPGHQQLGPRQQRPGSVGRLQQPRVPVRGQLLRGQPGRGAVLRGLLQRHDPVQHVQAQHHPQGPGLCGRR